VKQILVINVILVNIIQVKANHLVVLVMRESFKLIRVQVHVISAIRGNIKTVRDIRTVLIAIQDTIVQDLKTLLQLVVNLATTAQEEMPDKHVEPVHTQLRRMPATRVPVVAAALATIVQEVVLVINVHRVSTRQHLII
jgi:hypothetical protein